MLRRTAGFGTIDDTTAEAVLAASLATVTVRDDEHEIAGFARAVGDGLLYAFVTDVFVRPEARGRGVGDTLMSALATSVLRTTEPNATVAVIAAPGREAFYERHGFTPAPNDVFGSGMVHLGPVDRAALPRS